MFSKIPGRAYLIIGVLIFAASGSVTRRLTELGAANAIDGSNPISFCNVLFVGNICALLALLAIYSRQWNPSSISRLTISNWFGLMAVAILSGALAPALFFFALEQTAVNNVVLISRIEPPITLALSVLFLKAKVNTPIIIGSLLAFGGVVITVVLQPKENTALTMGLLSIGKGELMIALAAIATAISNVLSQGNLDRVPLGILTIFRTALGTVIFFALAVKLFGFEHFEGVFAPIVWQWMLVYGAIIVVGGQLAWFQGLKTTSAADVSLASSISPLAGIVSAYLILGEVPSIAHYIGGTVIIIGIILNQVGKSRRDSSDRDKDIKEMNEQIGFKGI